MDLIEKTLDKVYVYNGKVINLRKDKAQIPNGAVVDREVIEHNGGVCVLPLTDDNEIIFVRQYRYAQSCVLLEIPAGKLEKGEDPFECGKRELSEEVGASSENYTYLGKLMPTPAYDSEIIWMYMARDLSFGKQHLDVDEFVNVERIPFDKAVEMVLNNEIDDAKTQIAILKAKLLLEKNK